MRKCCLILLITFLSSCAGYKVNRNRNPFLEHGIHSINIPHFVNKGSVQGIGADLTKEFLLLMKTFQGLKIYNNRPDADATLIGIIKTPRLKEDAIQPVRHNSFNVGTRPPFNLPVTIQYNIDLELYLIKKPQPIDLKLVHSSWGPYLNKHPKMIMSEKFHYEYRVGQVVLNSEESGRDVNATQNKSLARNGLKNLSKQAARQFKQLVLNAY